MLQFSGVKFNLLHHDAAGSRQRFGIQAGSQIDAATEDFGYQCTQIDRIAKIGLHAYV